MNCIGLPSRCMVTYIDGGAQMQMREYKRLPIRLRLPHHHLLPSTYNVATDVDNPQITVAMPCVDILQSHATPYDRCENESATADLTGVHRRWPVSGVSSTVQAT